MGGRGRSGEAHAIIQDRDGGGSFPMRKACQTFSVWRGEGNRGGRGMSEPVGPGPQDSKRAKEELERPYTGYSWNSCIYLYFDLGRCCGPKNNVNFKMLLIRCLL